MLGFPASGSSDFSWRPSWVCDEEGMPLDQKPLSLNHCSGLAFVLDFLGRRSVRSAV